MEKKIQDLFEELRMITAAYMIYQEREKLEKIKNIIPQIQDFVMWFLEGNRFGIEDDLYQGLSKNLLVILEDILTALEQEDKVLLNDAVAYGLMEYLEMFIEIEQEDKADDNL